MPLPERLSYLYNAADFADDAREHAGATPLDFHNWWHGPVPAETIFRTIGGRALKPFYTFNLTDAEWNHYYARPTSVDEASGLILFDEAGTPDAPEPFAISASEPPHMIAHGDVRIVFNRSL